MAHRRMGGMGGPHRGGNRSFSHQPFQGNNVNPWQGDMQSNSMNQGGLISQLTSNPQQLALALTSLLQPQQQMNNPPSLLSLNTSPGFSNQDRDLNRFGNRGREFRRHEPYNKNRNGGWRPMDNNRNRRNKDRKRSPSNQKNKKVEAQKKDDPKKEKAEQNDASVDEGRDEDEETKRDWKAEKNNADDKKDAEGETKKTKEDFKKNEGPYYDIPQKFLNCFVCNKEMWDGESMQKHIRGRAHKLMLNSLEESIHCTVKILRENMRLAEEKKVIEMNRVQRMKKYSRHNDIQSHCNMCDSKFMGKILAHRKTEGHQRLKRYLHPKCHICDKEYPSRMEWVEHRLTPEHLRKLNEYLEKKGNADGELITNEDELDIEPLLEEPLQMESEHPILELTEDLGGLQNLIPAYKKDRAVSTQSLKPFSGFMCDLCKRSFENEELAQNHLKTRVHYYAFIDAAKKKYQQNVEEEKKKKNAEKTEENADESKDGEEKDMYDPEEACNEEEEENYLKDMEDENVQGEEAEEEVNGETEEAAEKGDEVAEIIESKEPVAEAAAAEEKQTRPVRRSIVKNGPGPKSKKLTPTAETTKAKEELDALLDKPSLSTFRIPKVEGASKPGPKSKKLKK